MRRYLTILMLLALLLSVFAPVAYAQGGQTIVGQSITVDDTHPVEGDLMVIGGSVTVTRGGRVEGDLLIWGGNADIAGLVEGDVMVWGGTVTLRASAVVEGDLFIAGGRLDRQPGATVKGEVRHQTALGNLRFFGLRAFPWSIPFTSPPPERWGDGSRVLSFFFNLFRIGFTAVGAAVIGLLVMILLPEPTQRVRTVAEEQPIASIGVGLLTLIVMPLLMLLLTITICLIPLAVVLGLTLLVAALYGWIALGLLIGERLMELLQVEKPLPLVAVLVGTLLISLLTAIPCFGWLIGFLGGSWGLGAVVLSRGGARGTGAWHGDRTLPSPGPPSETALPG